MRVCFTGIFISAALRRDGRSSIRGVPMPATPIHAVAVTVSYARGRRRRIRVNYYRGERVAAGEFRDDCFPLSLMSVGEYMAARVLRAFDPRAGCISTRADSQIIYRSLHGKPANHFHNKPPIMPVLS